ncbi:ribonuclease H-like protein [Lentinula novae-zelandiae]|nr:ribonuclease H-like protein [Lentinula novae-zelandiae]
MFFHSALNSLRPAFIQNSYRRCFNTYRAATKRRMGSIKPLDAAAGPMVWIDCEMRVVYLFPRLNPEKDKILEIAVLITNGNLEIVDEGVEYVIRTDKEVLDQMDEWCTKQHGSSGLTRSCLVSCYTREYVAKAVLAYVKRWVPNSRNAVLAGNSVHADRSFLVKEMPELINWLHYRCELARRWYKNPSQQTPRLYESDHRALSDIRGSIKELKWYRENLFVVPQPTPSKAEDYDSGSPTVY